MQEIIDKDLPIVKKEISIDEAREMFKDNPFKLEWIEQWAAEGKPLSIYWTGDEYVDFCKGPHVESTGAIKAFKLMSNSGAYWRGDDSNEMLNRVYGTAFRNAKELRVHLKMMVEAKKRDHRKIGKDQDFFIFSDLVGKGLPLWTERGATLRRELERFIVDEEIRRGYKHVYTPDIAKLDLYRTSGHYPYYKDSMYAPIKIDDEEFMLRPMTCPHHFELFKSLPRSYKELPMRIAELAKLYRYEQSGELSGLIRVRSFCLADAHIVSPKSKAEAEVNGALDLIECVCGIFGLKPNEDYWYRLSLGDRSDDKKYYKDDAAWDYAEEVLRKACASREVETVEEEDEAAFYGPKIDIQMKNVNGKEDSAFTVQYDFVMPKRFNLNFTNESGKDEEPVVVHRSSVGAIERVMGFLIERYSGNFPVWMHPEQVAILPVSEKHAEYAATVVEKLREEGVRVFESEVDQTVGNKIRKAQEMKIPYMLILGDQEVENNSVSVRLRTGDQLGEMSIEDLLVRVKEKIKSKSLDL
ncbi:MAG: threonine--tRNA ligase [Candidatus Dojkabacteria bacterium]|nr:threonine--tRNA ligase [Candidatus Dojkabacteria bacterium]